MVHVEAATKLYFYPADSGTQYIKEWELDTSKGKIRHTYGFGTIYVMQGGSILADYPARGGPKETFIGRDRHTHSAIPPRTYVLGKAVQYTTRNWPNSSIPWGAKIQRAANGEIQFDLGSGWKYATGSPTAPMTEACRRLFVRMNRKQPNSAEAATLNEEAKEYFDVDPDHPTETLVDVWHRNDFGAWAVSLQRDGVKTGFFIHTTPEDEITTLNKGTVNLSPSHGCIHMRPADRNEAKEKRYFKAGATLKVFGFDGKGPPE
jgi:hypothetical protein